MANVETVDLSASLKRSFTEPSNGKLEQFTETGMLSVENALDEKAYWILNRVCRRLMSRPLPKTRQVQDPGWHKVEKVTLFRHPQNLTQATHSMGLYSPELVIAARWSDGLIQHLGHELISLGYSSSGELLRDHQSSRAVIHRMNGSLEDPSTLGLHVDPPQEHGANLVLTLGQGTDLTTGSHSNKNTLNIYACNDFSEALEFPQPEHGFSSNERRLSLVFTNFIE